MFIGSYIKLVIIVELLILFRFYTTFVTCISRYSFGDLFLGGSWTLYRLSIWLFILVLLVCITIDAI